MACPGYDRADDAGGRAGRLRPAGYRRSAPPSRSRSWRSSWQAPRDAELLGRAHRSRVKGGSERRGSTGCFGREVQHARQLGQLPELPALSIVAAARMLIGSYMGDAQHTEDIATIVE